LANALICLVLNISFIFAKTAEALKRFILLLFFNTFLLIHSGIRSQILSDKDTIFVDQSPNRITYFIFATDAYVLKCLPFIEMPEYNNKKDLHLNLDLSVQPFFRELFVQNALTWKQYGFNFTYEIGARGIFAGNHPANIYPNYFAFEFDFLAEQNINTISLQ
jgi:hypothetical protein